MPKLVEAAAEGRSEADAWATVVNVVRADSDAALAVVRLIAARPGVNRIEVTIIREMLNASSARIERRQKSYAYDRP